MKTIIGTITSVVLVVVCRILRRSEPYYIPDADIAANGERLEVRRDQARAYVANHGLEPCWPGFSPVTQATLRPQAPEPMPPIGSDYTSTVKPYVN